MGGIALSAIFRFWGKKLMENRKILNIKYNKNSENVYDIIAIFVYDHDKKNEYLCIVELFEKTDQNEKTTFFVDDLTIFCPYLLKFAISHNLPYDYRKNNNVCSFISVNNYSFINFKSKFGCDFDYKNIKINFELIDYAEKTGRTGKSLGADAYNEFIHTILNKKPDPAINYAIMRHDNNFPIFEYDDILTTAKTMVYGFQFVKSGQYQNIYDYDISGSYPANALNSHPVGLPFYFNKLSDVPNSYFKIIKFTFFNLKCKTSINWLDIYTPIGTISLTERLFAEFKHDYDCDIIIKKIIAFKTRKSMFARFINDNVVRGKQLNKNKHIAKYNKYIGNAIIGYMGRNTKTIKNTAEITDNRLILGDIEQPCEPMYLPVYLSILDHAKTRFIRALRPHFDKLIYANTDGFMTTEPISLNELNQTNQNNYIGNFRLEHHYKNIYISCLNGYAGVTFDGELVNCISGMAFDNLLSVDEYRDRHFKYYINTMTADGRTQRLEVRL